MYLYNEFILTYLTQNVEKNTNTFFSTFFQIIFLFVVFIGILFLAYFSTKFIAKSKMGFSSNGNNISIIETRQIGINSSLILVKVSEKYILVSSTKDKVSFLTEIQPSDKIVEPENVVNNVDFHEILKNVFNKKSKDSIDKEE